MTTYSSMPQAERDEVFSDACEAFELTIINETDFRIILGQLGYNATDIEDEVRRYAPKP